MDIANRTTYRGQVTKIVNNATEYLESVGSKPTSRNEDNWDTIEEELSVFLQRLKIAHDGLNKANNEVRLTGTAEDLQKECNATVEYEDKAVACIAKLTQRLDKLHRSQNFKETSMRVPLRDNFPNCVKLPKLPLKTFSGDFKQWLPFWEQFRTVVHENNTLSGTDKFNYLQSTLRGEAAEALAGFTPSSACYESAIALLQEEFGSVDKLIDKTMNQLMTIPQLSSKSDVKGLRNLYNTVMTCTRSLTSMGIPSSNYSIMLKSKLLRCLSGDLRAEYFRFHKDGEQVSQNQKETSSETTVTASDSVSEISAGDNEIKYLLKFIKRETEALESFFDGENTRRQHIRKTYPTAAELFTTTSKECCFFCKSLSHQTKDCNGPHTLDQRKSMLKGDNRCFRCTYRGHSAKKCSLKRLRCETCKGWHVKAVCDPTYRRQDNCNNSAHPATVASKQPSNVCMTNVCTASLSDLGDVFLQTASVFAMNPKSNKISYVRLILDGGSQMSFLKESLAKKLCLPVVQSRKISIIPFGSGKQRAQECPIVRVTLKSQYDQRAVEVEVAVVPEICLDVLAIPPTDITESFKLTLADARPFVYQPDDGISILIGADCYWKFVSGNVKHISDRLTAIDTIFGWTLQGPAPVSVQSVYSGLVKVNVLSISAIDDFNEGSFWDLETIGIKLEKTQSDDFTQEFICKSIVKRQDRYQVCLPWREEDVSLDDNEVGARIRFKSLIRKLSRSPEDLFEYDKAMRELVDAGVAEKVPEECENTRKYYMPHRPVYRDDKTTSKLRIVFDASAHAQHCPSLNDLLLPGTNLLPDVFKILLNFRLGSIGIVSDIEKAFLQVSLDPKDRDVHRFFWYSEKLKSVHDLPDHQIYRMTRVTFGVTSSPFLLGATLKRHFENEREEFPQTCAILNDSLYMDDVVCSVDEENMAIEFHQQATSIFKRAAMNLRKWNCNNPVVRSNFLDGATDNQKVLGLIWYVHTDEIAVDIGSVEQFLKDMPVGVTKRSLLQVISRFFDPLGALGPFIINFKILFQRVWKIKLGWDDELPFDLLKAWNSYCTDIVELKSLSIPRSVCYQGISQWELHLFADASLNGYGTVAYIRSVSKAGEFSVKFLCATNRVAPIKNTQNELTLPRLELVAALIAARLCSYLVGNLKITFDRINLWTDSRITLCWISNETKKWTPFVANRVREIKTLTADYTWSHCPGKDNPADLLTRGVSAKQLAASVLWLHGPPWLLSSENWPSDDNEVFPDEISSFQVGVEAEHVNSRDAYILRVAEFSSWKRLLRVSAFIFRFVNILLKRNSERVKFLTAEEINQAERYWIKTTQFEHFSNEIKAIEKRHSVDKYSSIYLLNPFLDLDGILRVGSRLHATSHNEDSAYPIILPKRCHISQIIVLDAHQRMLHAGVNVVLTNIRTRFWILKARQLIKAILGRCVVCKKLLGKPGSQPFAPIPRERMMTSRPFDMTGIDFAGPLHINGTSDGGAPKKVYILLCTCGSIRAVHLELVTDLTAECCLLALRRFFARRGKPSIIISDNAKTFKRTSKELGFLNKALGAELIQGFASNEGIRWKFIVERAPWWGGFWERLVKSVKAVLKSTIGRSSLNFEELRTLLTEVECVINARPLTYITDDPKDLSPLTPSHFLTGSHETSSTPLLENPPADVEIRQKWNYRLKMLRFFWKRWRLEYLHQLRSLHSNKNLLSSNFKPNDVVLLYDPATSRVLWKLALIEEVYPGRDNKVRACQIRLSNGTKLRRPVQLLYPLELT